MKNIKWIIYLNLILCMILSSNYVAFSRNQSQKNEKKVANTGTLCDMFGNMPIQLTIGTGTGQPNMTYSSQLFSNIDGLNVAIIGDFVIDSDFSFLNSKFKIGNNSRIIVLANKHLTINNSKFFCCGTLWTGIELVIGSSGAQLTIDDSEFQNAKAAIKSLNNFGAVFSIENHYLI